MEQRSRKGTPVRRRSKRKRNQRRRRMQVLLGLLLFCSILILGISYIFFQAFVSKYPQGKIYKNIYIGPVDVSGLTEEEAEEEMEQRLNFGRQAKVKMKVGKKEESVPLEEVGLHYKDIKKQVKAAYDYGKTGSLWQRFWQLKDLSKSRKVFDENYILSKKQVKNLMDKRIVPLADHAQNAAMERKGNEFIIIEEKQGKTVDVEKSAAAILRHLNNKWDQKDFTLEMIQKTEKPSVKAADLETVKDELGSYSTDAGGGERLQNLKTGVKKLNGTVLGPGEEISVHDATAPYDKEHGYVAAGSYENGQVVETYGGGICQVSTTLYNAVLLAELEVTERHPHSMLVSYIDPSRDAAIAGDTKDFRFKNNYKTPIYIEGRIEQDGRLTFTVYGKETRKTGRTVEYESEVTSVEEYGRTYKEDSSAALGSMRYEGSPHTGKTARLWKIVKENGKEKSRDKINDSVYQKSNEIIKVGTACDNAEASRIVSSAIATQDGSKINEAISKAKTME